jgi:hypothetical protein
MKKELEEKVQTLVKSLYNKAKKAKDPVEDTLDGNMVQESKGVNTAEAGMALSEKKRVKKSDCGCGGKDECSCECDKDREETDDMEKTEAFVKSLMDNFQKISDAYLQKAAKMNKMGGPSLGSAISAGVQGSGSTPQGGIDAALGGATPPPAPAEPLGQSEKKGLKKQQHPKTMHPSANQVSKETIDYVRNLPSQKVKAKRAERERIRNKAKKKALKQKDKLESQGREAKFDPMNLSEDDRCWEGYEPTPGKKAYAKGSCQKKGKKS